MIVFGLLFISCQNSIKTVSVTVKNNLDVPRENETIVVKLGEIKQLSPSINSELIQVVDKNSGERLVCQIIDLNGDDTDDELIFQADFSPGESKEYFIQEAEKSPAETPQSKAYARFVPERMDDFAWENDRIAYRMYGPALQATGEISSGVDVWVKSVNDLILDKWYRGEDYHTDHGEGLDYYKVGPSTGCGGIAIWDGVKLHTSKNFIDWKIIANGPIRVIFELTYAPWEVNGDRISELKRITLDAGQNLSRFESTFTWEKDQSKLNCAIGIIKRKGQSSVLSNFEDGWLRYWEPEHKVNGTTGCGIVVDTDIVTSMTETTDHHLVISEVEPGKRLIYFAGACWSKNPDFPGVDDWDNYLKNFTKRINSPLQISVSLK